MPANVLSQVELTLTDMNRRIAVLRQEIPELSNSAAARALIVRITQAIHESIQAGMNAFDTEVDKKNFLKKLSARVHPDVLLRSANQALRDHLAPFTIGEQLFSLKEIPQLVVNTIQDNPNNNNIHHNPNNNDILFPEFIIWLYEQFMRDYKRYPEFVRTVIESLAVVVVEGVLCGVSVIPNPLMRLVLVVDVLCMVLCFSLLYGIFVDDEEQLKTLVNLLYFSPLSTVGLQSLFDLLCNDLIKSFAAGVTYQDMLKSELLRMAAVIALTAGVGVWLCLNTMAIIVGPVAIGLALLINTPLYLMDLLIYAVTGLVSVFSMPEPVIVPDAAPNSRAPSPLAANDAGFFAGAARREANDPAELYHHSMGID